jgi:hypothetical protein
MTTLTTLPSITQSIRSYAGRNSFVLKLKVQTFALSSRQLAVAADILETEAASAFAASIAPVAAPVAPVAPVALTIEDAGVYVMPDGTIVKVKANKAKTNVYASRWIEIRGERLNENETRVRGEYEYVSGLVHRVAASGRKMTLEEAKAFILRYGVCARCGRKLVAAKSVEQGIGPVCIQYFGGFAPAAVAAAASAMVAQPEQDDESRMRALEAAEANEFASPSDDRLAFLASLSPREREHVDNGPREFDYAEYLRAKADMLAWLAKAGHPADENYAHAVGLNLATGRCPDGCCP